MKIILWDYDDDQRAINYDGTDPKIIDIDTVLIKDLGCNCDPSSGSMCGGCAEVWREYKIGEDSQYNWREKP